MGKGASFSKNVWYNKAMELKDLYKKKLDKKSMAAAGVLIIDELRHGGKTFVELCETLNATTETIRACLNVLLKNGIVHNFLGEYVLEESVGDFVIPPSNRASNRKKYRSVVPAKCNLSLAVVGKGDKLHELDMFFCPFDLVWDEAEFLPADDNSLSVENATGDETFDEARFLRETKPKIDKIIKKFGVTGAISVRKGVPLGAGLGGSTSALVAIYFAIKKYADEKGLKYSFTPKFFADISSDFSAMALARACRVTGVGDKVETVRENVDVRFVGFEIAKGGSDTASVYKKFDEKCKILSAQPANSIVQALKNPRNDLFAPACALNKEIKKVYNNLKSKKPNFVLMTGSGSAVVALDYKVVE